MTIHYVVGDATEPVGEGRKIIAHIVNNAGFWGRGFVLALSKKWPVTREWYLQWYKERAIGPGLRLGAVQFVPVTEDIVVANMVGQNGIGHGNERPIRYMELFYCLARVRTQALATKATVHMPRIGCGLAGGTWEESFLVISGALVAFGVEVYVYDLNEQVKPKPKHDHNNQFCPLNDPETFLNPATRGLDCECK